MFLTILIIYYIIGVIIITSWAIITKTYIDSEDFVTLSCVWPMACILWCLYVFGEYITDFIEEQIDKMNNK